MRKKLKNIEVKQKIYCLLLAIYFFYFEDYNKMNIEIYKEDSNFLNLENVL